VGQQCTYLHGTRVARHHSTARAQPYLRASMHSKGTTVPGFPCIFAIFTTSPTSTAACCNSFRRDSAWVHSSRCILRTRWSSYLDLATQSAHASWFESEHQVGQSANLFWWWRMTFFALGQSESVHEVHPEHVCRTLGFFGGRRSADSGGTAGGGGASDGLSSLGGGGGGGGAAPPAAASIVVVAREQQWEWELAIGNGK
jgi:hypothetical protein